METYRIKWYADVVDYVKQNNPTYSEIKKMTFIECTDYFRNVLGIQREKDDMIQDWKDMSYDYYKNHLQLKPFALEYVKKCAKEGKCMIYLLKDLNMCVVY